jgi:hypothetical protein
MQRSNKDSAARFARPAVSRTTVSASCASLAGIGIARFADTPLCRCSSALAWLRLVRSPLMGLLAQVRSSAAYPSTHPGIQ